MPNPLVELAAEIVISHASCSSLSREELLETIFEVHAILAALDKGEKVTLPGKGAAAGAKGKRGRPGKAAAPEQPVVAAEPARPAVPEGPALPFEEAFQPDEVGCMICGRKGFKTLKKHLSTEHGMKPGQYKRKFKIPKDVDLVAPNYAAARREQAIARGLPEKLAAARALRKKKGK